MITKKEIQQEKEADYFARCILMPYELLKKEFETGNKHKKLPPEKVVQKLAQKFQVSPLQMTLRLRELNIL